VTGMSHAFDKIYVYDKTGKVPEGGTSLDRPMNVRSVNDATVITSTPIASVTEFVVQCEAQSGFSGIFFVCVPTPMKQDGSCDTSIAWSVVEEIAKVPVNGDVDRVVCVKSTVPPGSVEKWNEAIKGSRTIVTHNPEFLTERNAIEDFKNQNRIVIGGPIDAVKRVSHLYSIAYPGVLVVETTSTTSEMVKYFTNVQLATRVVLSCELAEVVDALVKKGFDVKYDDVKCIASHDHRLGGSHMNVPGFDGIRGARGSCFNKDLNGLLTLSEALNVDTKVMNAVNKKNLQIVPIENRDWLTMERAVVKS